MQRLTRPTKSVAIQPTCRIAQSSRFGIKDLARCRFCVNCGCVPVKGVSSFRTSFVLFARKVMIRRVLWFANIVLCLPAFADDLPTADIKKLIADTTVTAGYRVEIAAACAVGRASIDGRF